MICFVVYWINIYISKHKFNSFGKNVWYSNDFGCFLMDIFHDFTLLFLSKICFDIGFVLLFMSLLLGVVNKSVIYIFYSSSFLWFWLIFCVNFRDEDPDPVGSVDFWASITFFNGSGSWSYLYQRIYKIIFRKILE